MTQEKLQKMMTFLIKYVVRECAAQGTKVRVPDITRWYLSATFLCDELTIKVRIPGVHTNFEKQE